METKNVNLANVNFVPMQNVSVPLDLGLPFDNAHIASVSMSPLEFQSKWGVLNTKINSILGNHVLYDTDVRDMYTIMGELGLRGQWKEMNAKIRAELEGISKHVEEATQILDANPPKLEWRSYTAPVALAAAPVAVMPSFGFSSAVVAPTVEHAYRYEPVTFEDTRFGLEKPELVSMPWQQWNCEVNTQVASADVKEIIPVKKQVVVRRLFGEWDALMEDVAEWHRRGLYRYQVRLMAPQAVQLAPQTVQLAPQTVQMAPQTVQFAQNVQFAPQAVRFVQVQKEE